MNYTIENDILQAEVCDIGAELVALRRKDNGVDYLWLGDETYWAGHAANLFPICGRLWEGKYTYRGKTYEMLLHGFTRKMPLTLVEKKADAITFAIRANEETLKTYPFDFTYTVTIALIGETVRTTYSATNHGGEPMPFAFGGHPGFFVPLGGDGDFSDWYVQFEKDAKPQVMDMVECYMTETTTPLPLDEQQRYRLHHSMFDNDAIFMKDAGHELVLASEKSDHSVTVTFPDMQYVGFWHVPHVEAPYMCIEPWMSVAAYHGKIDDLETKRDMIHLAPGATRTASFDVTVR